MPKIVYTDMVGDLFHKNHAVTFAQARELGDALIVGVHSDATVAGYKRPPIMSQDERYRIVRAHPLVDRIIEDAPLEVTDELLDGLEVDVLVHGGNISLEELRMMYAAAVDRGIYVEVPYKEGVSTSGLIERIGELYRGRGVSLISPLEITPEFLALHGTDAVIPTERVPKDIREVWKDVPASAISPNGCGVSMDKAIRRVVRRMD